MPEAPAIPPSFTEAFQRKGPLDKFNQWARQLQQKELRQRSPAFRRAAALALSLNTDYDS